jgi:Ran-binding protein 1
MQEEEHDPQFEPVIKLTEQIEANTGEDEEDVIFKMYAFYQFLLFSLDSS